MDIKKVEAWAYDGQTYPSEGKALAAAIAKVIGQNNGVAQKVIDNATALIPYLQRVVEIERERNPGKPRLTDPVKPPAIELDGFGEPALTYPPKEGIPPADEDFPAEAIPDDPALDVTVSPFNEGTAAFLAGAAKDSNPYNRKGDYDQHAEWNRGFQQAWDQTR